MQTQTDWLRQAEEEIWPAQPRTRPVVIRRAQEPVGTTPWHSWLTDVQRDKNGHLYPSRLTHIGYWIAGLVAGVIVFLAGIDCAM